MDMTLLYSKTEFENQLMETCGTLLIHNTGSGMWEVKFVVDPQLALARIEI